MRESPPVNAATAAEVPEPLLATRRVRLARVSPHHVGLLYEMATDPRTGFRWRFRGATPSPDEFTTTLWEGVLAQFVMEETSSSRLIGQVVAYDAQPGNGHCHVAFLSDDAATGTGLALEGAGLFVAYLFQHWPFRKLYAEVPDFTLSSFAGGLGRYFELEGTLREHAFFGGRWWDVHIIAVYRSAGEEIGTRLAYESGAFTEAPELSFDQFVAQVIGPLGLGGAAVTPETTFADLGVDSLHVVEIEEQLGRLGCEFPPELLAGVRNLGDLHHYVGQAAARRAAPRGD
jgi:RimJ/RimL family protein N-acetyltransferase/acyl carrier protein